MAAGITLAKIWDTPYAVAYLATHAGGAGNVSVNVDAAGAGSPDLVTDSTAGTEIRKLITNNAATGALAWLNQAAARGAFGHQAAVATADPRGKVLVIPRAGATAPAFRADIDVTAGPGNLRLTVGAIDDGTAVVILRKLHSVGR